MRYRNARDIIPDHLLEELQKYVSGENGVYSPVCRKRKDGEQYQEPVPIIRAE